ncbi:Iterative polyketide synthase afoE [Penicillium rolfsii]|nr:Iterative polyketide synthase afoE [Penicillium rolfsii]
MESGPEFQSAEPNYFTCTLGEAASQAGLLSSTVNPFTSILDVIDRQAETNPDLPAVGFAQFESRSASDGLEKCPDAKCAPAVFQALPSAQFAPDPISFRDLRDKSLSAARALKKILDDRKHGATVGLLCASSLDFVWTWLGLTRLAHPVILLAPQLEPQAIEHLCRRLQADVIFCDDAHESATRRVGKGIDVLSIPVYHPDPSPGSSNNQNAATVEFHVRSDGLAEPAFYFHTSGTSTGLPSPIPQSHAMVKALPCFSNKDEPATFTTTPLYHGGLADCLRAWTSGAMLWCFPEGKCPLTARNVVKALEWARRASSAPIKFFSSVPYVLQMLAEDERGLQILGSMDLVGVGGAAMPVTTGNLLVHSGINLLSRFGSAECGFLLSSHRNYKKDQEWQYLRVRVASDLLQFEARENGLCELVVQPEWPFRTKTNREDGSYATSDLFEPHPHRRDLWRYHSRADSQITLANGKKFDPAPLEQELQSTSPLVQDVYVFGTGKPCAGALLFPQSEATPDAVVASVKRVLPDLNSRNPPHARIGDSMLVVVPRLGVDEPLPKSSKGSILRHQADDMYMSYIEAAYNASHEVSGVGSIRLEPGDLLTTLLASFSQVLQRSVDPDQDLYQQGVDSIACMQIRKSIEAKRLMPSHHRIPLNVIYDHGTIRGLVSYIQQAWDPSSKGEHREGGELLHMESLVNTHGMHECRSTGMKPRSSSSAILLTGATGFLGAYVLGLLRRRTDITKIFCLVRATTRPEARERVSQCQKERGFSPLPDTCHGNEGRPFVSCLPFKAGLPNLGLEEDDRLEIVREVSVIVHGAWPVNFNLPLASFQDQFSCLAQLLALAKASDAHLIFISSLAAASSTDRPSIQECISTDPSDAAPLGYARSKWVAENICAKANRNWNQDPSRVLASIIRIGQLSGDSATGAWNRSEAYPLMFSASNAIGSLPDLPDEGTNWLPVDVAAKAVIEISLQEPAHHFNGLASAGRSVLRKDSSEVSATPVYHVANPFDSTLWSQVLSWICNTVSTSHLSRRLEIIPARIWVNLLGDKLDEKHPAHSLLGFWKEAFKDGCEYRPNTMPMTMADLQKKRPSIEIARASNSAQSMSEVAPLDEENVKRLWQWIQQNV